MIHFGSIDATTFLTEYWQKKPLVIRNAILGFINPLTPDELAGLAMDEDVESRIVSELPSWQLNKGPFDDTHFSSLPKTHWTLLVQSVDLLIPEVAALLDHFDFIPQWRVDDVMISYAVEHGNVGPHYDNYDVFLYQASGRRKWSLTTQHCHENNYLSDVELRIMKTFEIEESYVLEEGDMLYLPAHVGHHGVSLDDDCMTYSFGYRSYQQQELWDSFGDYASEHPTATHLYQDPNWAILKATSELPRQSWLQAKKLMQAMLDDEALLQSWFGCFATRLDQQAEQLMPFALEDDELETRAVFIDRLRNSQSILRDTTCRMAYIDNSDTEQLFINGCQWNIDGVSFDLIKPIANARTIVISELLPFLAKETDQQFLHDLWKLQWISIL